MFHSIVDLPFCRGVDKLLPRRFETFTKSFFLQFKAMPKKCFVSHRPTDPFFATKPGGFAAD